MYSVHADDLSTITLDRLFDHHPWNIKKNIKLMHKAKKSSADQSYIELIKKWNAFITFELIVNRLKYDTTNIFFLPTELWNIIKSIIYDDFISEYYEYKTILIEDFHIRNFKPSALASIMQLVVPYQDIYYDKYNMLLEPKMITKKITWMDIRKGYYHCISKEYLSRIVKVQQKHNNKQNKLQQKNFFQKQPKHYHKQIISKKLRYK